MTPYMYNFVPQCQLLFCAWTFSTVHFKDTDKMFLRAHLCGTSFKFRMVQLRRFHECLPTCSRVHWGTRAVSIYWLFCDVGHHRAKVKVLVTFKMVDLVMKPNPKHTKHKFFKNNNSIYIHCVVGKFYVHMESLKMLSLHVRAILFSFPSNIAKKRIAFIACHSDQLTSSEH